MRTWTCLATLWMMLGVVACSSDASDGASGGTGGSGADGGVGGSSAASGAGGGTSCLGDIAWYSENATGSAAEPGKKVPNAYGLYDMLGNTVEWVQDCYHDTYTGAPTDGSVWDEANCGYRVIRGGCYGSTARGTRVSMRDGVQTNFYGTCAPGVRCVRTSSTVPATAKIQMNWVAIPAGSFSMGCSAGDSGCYDNELPAHTVTVGAFEMTDKEPTQQEFFDQTGDSPATVVCKTCAETYVSWEDAQAFCQALGGRLPTEAEWEYAARGGTATRYYCGD